MSAIVRAASSAAAVANTVLTYANALVTQNELNAGLEIVASGGVVVVGFWALFTGTWNAGSGVRICNAAATVTAVLFEEDINANEVLTDSNYPTAVGAVSLDAGWLARMEGLKLRAAVTNAGGGTLQIRILYRLID